MNKRALLLFILSINYSCINTGNHGIINDYIIEVIERERIFDPSDDLLKDYDACAMNRLRSVGLDVETSKRGIELFYQGMLKRGYENFSVTTSEYEVFEVYDLNLIVGCCCLNVGAEEIKVGYYGLLNEDNQLLIFGCSYLIDKQTDELRTGCGELRKQLDAIKFQVRYQMNSVMCVSN